MKIVVDKMHMVGHVDPWCKEQCDPRKFKELDNMYIPHTCSRKSVSNYKCCDYRLTLKHVSIHSNGSLSLRKDDKKNASTHLYVLYTLPVRSA